MRIDDTLKLFLKTNPALLLANRTAWKREITGPDFVSTCTALHSRNGKVLEQGALEVMEVEACEGNLGINHYCDKALQ